ncbi:gluconate 2-dehydrogenase subunit 3 family protein [Parapedobacter sp. DT-150]|uniref:gluconate 2-dehydrogenase subunit 3 family protein n=1 Tax=Parapedobacter sp. DT-150 TaxID=3396162 RepID=UPI003F1B71A4
MSTARDILGASIIESILKKIQKCSGNATPDPIIFPRTITFLVSFGVVRFFPVDRKAFVKYIFTLGAFSMLIMLFVRKFGFGSRLDINELTAKKQLIEELVSTIIPRTDTPGAKESGVAEFVIDMICDCTAPKEQQMFLSGLHNLEKYTIKKHQCPFVTCSLVDKIAVLTHFEKHDVYRNPIFNKLKMRLFGEPFIIKLKRLTVEGYCTSLLGATQGLAYDFVPITYESCISLTPGQRAWAIK